MLSAFHLKVKLPRNDAAEPDLALFDKNYKHWAVIEVEMASHSLVGQAPSRANS